MGHRALVAFERPDGRYDLHHSQWGADELQLLATLERLDGRATPAEAPGVHAEPILACVSTAVVLDFLDPREYEALFVVGDDVAAYLVLWLGLEAETAPWDRTPASLVRNGAALVPVADPETGPRVRQFVRITKEVLGDAVAAGILPAWMAVSYLGSRLARRPLIPAETIWLPLGWWTGDDGDVRPAAGGGGR